MDVKSDYGDIESECLRLFKDLHVADPLYRRLDRMDRGDRPKLTVKRLFQHSTANPSSASSSATTFSRGASSAASSMTSSRRSTATSAGNPPRRVYLTEVPEANDGLEDEEAANDEILEDDGTQDSLAEILQTEAEAFAAELQEAEQFGVDAETLDSLESDFAQTAEALVTMKEARTKLAEIRKDRGYGRPGAGDKECPRPGAGVALPKSGAMAKGGKPKQVKIAEALNVTISHDAVPTNYANLDTTMLSTTPITPTHEASMVLHVGSMTLDSALSASLSSASRSTLVSNAAQAMPEDKLDVGAPDSACDRTCAGPLYMVGILYE